MSAKAVVYEQRKDGRQIMTNNGQSNCKRQRDKGASILIIAVAMIFVLGMAGLGIDLASLYVARSEAQRSADAAALAGANALASATNSCVTVGGGTISAACQAIATQQAEKVGNLNLIAGVSPHIGLESTDVKFLSTSASDPQIQVIASRNTAHGNPMPTFFVKIFGVDTANVSAKAVAEAFISAGVGEPVGSTCVKPWLIPNCDPGNTGQTNNNCSPSVGPFVETSNGGSYSTTPAPGRDTEYPNGYIGEPFTLKPGTPGGAGAPGQYYAAFLPNASYVPTECPACSGNNPLNGGVGSAAIYRSNIECCNQNPVVCGPTDITLASSAGNMVGPTTHGVECLINQSGSTFTSNCGQDYLSTVSGPCNPSNNPPKPAGPDFKIIAGVNDPYSTPGEAVPSGASSSLVTLPIWNGTPLQSGQNSNLVVVGFMQLFIQDVDPSSQGTVYGNIVRIITCGNSGGTGNGNGGNAGAVVGTGSPVPVRLIE